MHTGPRAPGFFGFQVTSRGLTSHRPKAAGFCGFQATGRGFTCNRPKATGFFVFQPTGRGLAYNPPKAGMTEDELIQRERERSEKARRERATRLEELNYATHPRNPRDLPAEPRGKNATHGKKMAPPRDPRDHHL